MYVNIPEVGECLLKHNARSKAINAKWVNNMIVFTIPPHISFEEALKIINKDTTPLTQFKAKISNTPVFKFIEGETVELPHFSVYVESNNTGKSLLTYVDKERKLTLSYNKEWDISSPETQDSIKRTIENACRRKAQVEIPPRIRSFAAKHNFKYKGVKINSSRGKWGSCSSVGNINISLYCMLIPTHLLDLVLLHELCHTVEMNHSKLFWDLLDKVTDGKCKELTQELKEYKLLW